MANRVGQQLGNYWLVELLGEGGFAGVYLGQHCYLNSYAALKVLGTALSERDEQRFLSEAQTLVRLRHPNIVRVLEFFVEQGTPVLVMDYAPRGTLRERHPLGSCLPLATTLTYVKQIAAALQYAHNHGIIHRDVKPENMLLDADEHLLLTDFGLALLAPTSDLLTSFEMVGTLPYVAPEQLRGKPDFASDQYALGIVIYEWLCGRYPFEGDMWEMMHQHQSVPPPSLLNNRTDLSTEVEEVVLKALAKDPQQRFASVQAFALALERASKKIIPAGEHNSQITASLKAAVHPSAVLAPVSPLAGLPLLQAQDRASLSVPVVADDLEIASLPTTPHAPLEVDMQISTILLAPLESSIEKVETSQQPKAKSTGKEGDGVLEEQDDKSAVNRPLQGTRNISSLAESSRASSSKNDVITGFRSTKRRRVLVIALILLTVTMSIIASIGSGWLASLRLFGTIPGRPGVVSPGTSVAKSPAASIPLRSSSPSPTRSSPSPSKTPVRSMPTSSPTQATPSPTSTQPAPVGGFPPTYNVIVRSAQALMLIAVSTTVSASCSSGEQMLGGGYYVGDQVNPVQDNYPSAPHTWTVRAYSGTVTTTLHVYVVCLQANFSAQIQIYSFSGDQGSAQTFACPAGSTLTGGGFRNEAAISEPNGNGWLGKSISGGPANDNYVLCASANLKAAPSQSQQFTVAPQGNNSINLSCPNGELTVGGGFSYDYAASDVYLDGPVNGSSTWTVGAFNNDNSATYNGTGWAVCVQVPTTVH